MKLPSPRLELLWEPINEVDPRIQELADKGLLQEPIPRYDWKCTYSLVIPLTSNDIRRVDDSDEMKLQINVTRCQRNSRSPILNDCSVDVPFRDGLHIKWDCDALGGTLPMFVVCDNHIDRIR